MRSSRGVKKFIYNLLMLPLGCFGGGGGYVAPAAPPPQAADSGVIQARDDERRRKRMAGGNTILTSATGVANQPTAPAKSLLGQ